MLHSFFSIIILKNFPILLVWGITIIILIYVIYSLLLIDEITLLNLVSINYDLYCVVQKFTVSKTNQQNCCTVSTPMANPQKPTLCGHMYSWLKQGPLSCSKPCIYFILFLFNFRNACDKLWRCQKIVNLKRQRRRKVVSVAVL